MNTPHVRMHPELEKPENFPEFHTVFIGEMYYWIAQRLPLTYTMTVEQHSTQNLFGGINRYRSDVEVSQVREPAATYETTVAITPPHLTVDIPDPLPRRGTPLPTLPIPLRAPDADVPLPLEYLVQQYPEKSGLGRRFASIEDNT